VAVAERRLPVVGSASDRFGGVGDALRRRLRKDVRPHGHGFGSLRALPNGHTGRPEDTGLLLDAARIGERDRRLALQPEEIQEVQRLDAVDGVGHVEVELVDVLPRARVDGIDDRETSLVGVAGDAVEQPLEPLGVVDVARPVGGQQGERLPPQVVGREHVAFPAGQLFVLSDCVDDGVASHLDAPVRNRLGPELVGRLLGGCKEVLGGVVDEYPVELLRHLPVEAPEAGLDVGQGPVALAGDNAAREGRVRVALDDDDVGRFALEHLSQTRHHLARLGRVVARPDFEVVLRGRQFQVVEEHLVEALGVVLARMHDAVVDSDTVTGSDYRREFDYLGTRSEHEDQSGRHGRTNPPFFYL